MAAGLAVKKEREEAGKKASEWLGNPVVYINNEL